MRKKFTELLQIEMELNEDIYVILGDVGYGVFDNLRKKYPERIINAGSSEQLMIGMASGMALEGKIPIVYSITPFILFRPFEFIRNLVNHEKIPIKIVGSGRDDDYGTMGFTHYATDDEIISKVFKNIETIKPETKEDIDLDYFLYTKKPIYLNLKR